MHTPITRNIHVGSFPWSRETPRLKDEGFGLVALCAEELQPSHRDYPGLAVVHCPLADDGTLPKDKLALALRCAGIIVRWMAENPKGRVLITCAQGRNRSAFLAALVVAHEQRLSPFDAGAMVRRKRQADLALPVLSNPAFRAALAASEMPALLAAAAAGKV